MSKKEAPHSICEQGNCRDHRHSECPKQNREPTATEMDRIDFVTDRFYGHVIDRDMLINALDDHNGHTKTNR